MKRGVPFALFAGLVVLAALIDWQGAGAVTAAAVAVGSGMFAVVAFHLVPIALATAAWFLLLGRRWSGGYGYLIMARWVREGVNALLPVAQVGGDIVGVRLLMRAGAAATPVGASVIADKTMEAVSQLVVASAALTLVISGPGTGGIEGLLPGLAVATVLIGGFLLAQRWGLLRLAERLLVKAAGAAGAEPDAFRGIHEAVWATYRDWRRCTAALALHALAWSSGAVEVWLILRFMGHPVGLGQAFALESLGQAVRSAAFAIPGALGAQEAGYMALMQMVGLPAEIGLALSLVKRVRQIVLGVPALLVWQWLEARRPAPVAAERSLPAVPRPRDLRHGSWNRRAARWLLRPLLGTGLTPNHVTAARWAFAIAACACFAHAAWGWGAALWTVSTFLDRCDGELARMTRRESRPGLLFDLIGDVMFNSAVFVALGFGLADSRAVLALPGFPDLSWTVVGFAAGLGVLVASIFAEMNEQGMRDGERTFNGRWGFEFDDFIYLIGAFAVLGGADVLLVAGAIGGTVMALLIGTLLAGRKVNPAGPESSRRA